MGATKQVLSLRKEAQAITRLICIVVALICIAVAFTLANDVHVSRPLEARLSRPSLRLSSPHRVTTTS